jgi:hypothetical protein
MKPDDATKQFRQADDRYRRGQYDAALLLLEELDDAFPNDKNLMFARARTLGKLGRCDEALEICDRLVAEFDYARAARLQVRLLKSMTEQIEDDADQEVPATAPAPLPNFDVRLPEDNVEDDEPETKERRFRIKPIRLFLLAGLVTLAALRFVPIPVAIGLVVGYFVLKWVAGAAIKRLFTMPFKMKGKALEGAIVDIHGVTPAPQPEPHLLDDIDPNGPELRFVWIDMTVHPQEHTEGFSHWEPGELVLAPLSMRIKGLDDLDKCFSVLDARLVGNGTTEAGEDEDDDFGKYAGPARIKLMVGLPKESDDYQFVYYTETFGHVHVPA